MSVYLDYNAKFTSGAFNAKDSFLYSSGVINHINLSYLTSTFVTGTLGLGAATISGGTNGAVMLNGLLILLDNNIQLLTGSIPNTVCPISVAITQQDNTPYFAYYPYGVVPSNYVKMATYLQQYQSWVYEPIIGPTRSLIKNSWGYKEFYPVSASTTGISLFGGEGYIYSDYTYSTSTAVPDSRCGISITSTYPIPTSSGASYFGYSTQLVLEPFTKTFLNVPYGCTRQVQTYSLATLTSSMTYAIKGIPGPLITGAQNSESIIVSLLTSANNNQWSICAISVNSSTSIVTGTTAYVLAGSSPILVPTLDPMGHKWGYLDTSNHLNIYNVGVSNITGSLITPTSSFVANNISAVSLGALTFIMQQNGSNVDLMALVGSVSSTLWPEIQFTINGLTSTAQLLVDRQAIAHILFISGTSLLSYNYPLGTGTPSGTISYIAPATMFAATQNMLGDSIIVIGSNNAVYSSINFSPFTFIVSSTSLAHLVVNADVSSFGIVIAATGTNTLYYISSLDNYHYLAASLNGNIFNVPVMGTISPMILSSNGTITAYPLSSTVTNLPSILKYRFNPNAYPSGTSEIIYPNELHNESRMNTALDLTGHIRPQTISSTNLYVTGDNGNWYQIRVGLDGSLYTSIS